MLIYFNAREIKNIFENSNPCSPERFAQILQDGGHQLVYSWQNISEIAAPLLYSKEKAEVLELLVKIEELPHIYINSAGIPRLELESAAKGFSSGDLYTDIRPMVQRFDYVVNGKAPPPTGDRPDYPLAEIVWDLYSFGALGDQNGCAEKIKEICAKDRGASSNPEREKHFTIMLARNLRLFQVAVSPDHLPAFAGWVYSEPASCSAQRLRFEIWQTLVRSPQDHLSLEDWRDFSHIDCLPYVDFFSLGKGMKSVVSKVCTALKVDYAGRAFSGINEVLGRL